MAAVVATGLDPENVVGELAEVVDRLAAAPLRATLEAVGDEIVGLRRQVDRLEFEICRRLGRWESLDRADGGRGDSTALLRSRTRMGAIDARSRQEVARELRLLPEAERAFADGEITLGHAVSLARCIGENGIAAVTPSAAALLDTARRRDADVLRQQARQVRFRADPAGALADAERAHTRRFLRTTVTDDGRFWFEALLPGEEGSLVRTAIDAFAAVGGPDDLRSARQRHADALVELSRQALQARRAPVRGGERPHVTMTVSAETLQAAEGSPGALLRWGAIIPQEAARRIACDAAITEVAVGAQGEPLSVGRARRTIPGPLRRAVHLRDGGCVWPGCGRPVEWCDVHHIVAWQDGGETKLDNLACLCRLHHRLLHEGGWSWEEVLTLRAGAPSPETPRGP